MIGSGLWWFSVEKRSISLFPFKKKIFPKFDGNLPVPKKKEHKKKPDYFTEDQSRRPVFCQIIFASFCRVPSIAVFAFFSSLKTSVRVCVGTQILGTNRLNLSRSWHEAHSHSLQYPVATSKSYTKDLSLLGSRRTMPRSRKETFLSRSVPRDIGLR